jgi:hypothetical protein
MRCLKGQWETVSLGPCHGDSNKAVSAKTGAVELWLSGGLLGVSLGVGGEVHGIARSGLWEPMAGAPDPARSYQSDT